MPVSNAYFGSVEPTEGVYCEGCNARLATGIYDVGGVEALLCRGCGQDRSPDGGEVVFDRGSVWPLR
ncbi:hypothetical protein ACODT3_43200 [Streptomyces sp. 4.24]|uniref:hypothetical protein n=1 Tax=Streptomyces tritrimontium TaxID=3406573 RepID=UPI003BB71B6A